MNENNSDINMVQLKRALQQAALPADCQIARLRPFDVPFEVADDVGNWILWLLQCPRVMLTDEQRICVSQLDSLLSKMSDQGNADLWTEEALRSRPEWDEVRKRAREALALFRWPLEGKYTPQDEWGMLKEAVSIAALPADQQIESFPKGSPVPEWIAGDFFNWFGLAVRRGDLELTTKQLSALNALNDRLNEMSESHERDMGLWTEEGLRRRSEWAEVRRDAKKILDLFHWSFEKEDNLDMVVVRPKCESVNPD